MSEQQYPTSEQIAEALYENQFRGGYHAEWDRLVEYARDHWLSQADAVFALFPQQTSSAEPTVQVHESVVKAAAGHLDREGYHGTATLLLDTLIPEPTTPIEPPSIADMAQGATFTRDDYPGEVWTVKRDVCDGGIYVLSDGHRSQNAEDIDPSTIRDVTAPKDAA